MGIIGYEPPELTNLLKTRVNPILVAVPVGDSDLKEKIQYETIGLTIGGCLFLLTEFIRKSSE